MTPLLRRLRRWYCRTAHRDLWVWDHYAASWVCVKDRERWASPCKAGAPTHSYRVTGVHPDGDLTIVIQGGERVLAIRACGGPTTLDVQRYTGSMAPATDISELRQNGYVIDCEYAGKTATGQKIFRYHLRGKKENPST